MNLACFLYENGLRRVGGAKRNPPFFLQVIKVGGTLRSTHPT
jgi:hypothetical protein